MAYLVVIAATSMAPSSALTGARWRAAIPGVCGLLALRQTHIRIHDTCRGAALRDVQSHGHAQRFRSLQHRARRSGSEPLALILRSKVEVLQPLPSFSKSDRAPGDLWTVGGPVQRQRARRSQVGVER